MDSTRRILIGCTAAAVGAVLGCSLWFGTSRTLFATSQTPAATQETSEATPALLPPADGEPSSADLTAPAARPSSPEAERAFQELSERLQAQVKEAGDRQAAAREAIEPLQGFIRQYPDDAITDKAYLSLGNMQLAVNDTAGAIAAFERVAARSTDAKLKSMAALFLGKAHAQAGQIHEARAAFEKLIATEQGSQYADAAQEALGRLSIVPGGRPPSFVMRDLRGRNQSPEQYHGKVLLIDFWATWCQPCLEEMPNLRRVYDRYHDRGFEIVGVSLDTDAAALQEFVAEEKLPWPQICDERGPKGELARRMGVISIPTLVLIDRKGVIRHVNTRGAALEAAVKDLVEEGS